MQRFIHIPKNGGTAVTTWLKNNKIDFVVGKIPKGVGKHRTVSSFLEESIPRFCIVRNPYTRIISYYNYISPVEGWDSFRSFIINKTENSKFNIPSPWKLQSDWIYVNNQPCVETIFHYETLEKEIQSFFNSSAPLPKENISTKSVTVEDLDPELRQVIADHFADDFNNFNYKLK